MRREIWLPAVALASGLVLGAGTIAFTADTPPGSTYGQSGGAYGRGGKHPHIAAADRKSTRLNSSHVAISYAVFCLKKKNTRTVRYAPRVTLRSWTPSPA